MSESKQCGAKTRSGGRCKNPPMRNGRCRMHGGKSIPGGVDHHSYKHGRFSKHRSISKEYLEAWQTNTAEMHTRIIMRRALMDADVETMRLIVAHFDEYGDEDDEQVDDPIHSGHLMNDDELAVLMQVESSQNVDAN